MKKGGGILYFLAIFCLPGFFIFSVPVSASDSVVINEVAWAGSEESSYDEWVELYNYLDSEIDLSGWTLEARDGAPKIFLSGTILGKGFFLLERTDDDSSPALADMFYSGSLGNGGEYLELKDENGSVVFSLDASSGWPGGDNIDKTTAQLCAEGWSSGPGGGTPKMANVCKLISDDTSSEDNDKVFRFGDLIINEFVSSPETGDEEWVELYHPGSGRLELDGWTLVDGSLSKTYLSGVMESGDYFFVIDSPKGQLNNSGDEINLYSPDGNLIDRVVYGDWGSSTESNAPLPGKGYSAALKEDGLRKSFLSESFFLTSEPTPGQANILLGVESVSDEESVLKNKFSLRITEIFPNPVGSDREGEFIEFKNESQEEVDLNGWRLVVEGGKTLEFGKNFLAAPKVGVASFFVLWRKDSLAALDNDGGRLELFSPGKKTPSQVVDYPSIKEGWAFADTSVIASSVEPSTRRFLTNSLSVPSWALTMSPTPGADNEIWAENHEPLAYFSLPAESATGAVMIFDASDSVDEDGDDLSFLWDFGDGVTSTGETVAHIFYSEGSFPLRLSVSDGFSRSSFEKIFVVGDSAMASKKNTSAEPSSDNDQGGVYNWPLMKSILFPEEPELKEDEACDIEVFNIGEKVVAKGVVLVEPGVFGKQFFYIIGTAKKALKVYNYRSDFPKISLGDIAVVTGEVSGSGERYIKIADQSGVGILSSGEVVSPNILNRAITTDDLWSFVEVDGIIEKSNGKVGLVMSSNDKISLVFKGGANVSAADFDDGQTATIVGVILDSSSGPVLAPRSLSDVALNSEGSKDEKTGLSILLEKKDGEDSSGREWVLPERTRGSRALVYLLILSLGVIIILAGLVIKEKIKNKK